MDFFGYFDRAYVINLPARRDRRAETEAMFRRSGFPNWKDRVEFFPAIAPKSAVGYPTIGARGALLSHAAVLRKAMEAKARNVLVMEDDLEISGDLIAGADELITFLEGADWAFAYFGHNLVDEKRPAGAPPMRPHPGHLMLGHFYAVNAWILPRLVEFMEGVDTRPSGHVDGGAMYSDGARNLFRKRNPDAPTFIAVPCMGTQRNTRSDITPNYFDRIPGIAGLAEMARRLKRRASRGPLGRS